VLGLEGVSEEYKAIDKQRVIGEGQQSAQPELLEHPNWPSLGASRLPYLSPGEETVEQKA
jgi:hypothetical protein